MRWLFDHPTIVNGNHLAYLEWNYADTCYLVYVNIVQICNNFGIANDYKVVERCKIYDAHYSPNRTFVDSFDLIEKFVIFLNYNVC